VQDAGIKDTEMYQKFLTSYFGETSQLDSSLPIPVPAAFVSQQ
jgi:hypothetical protein